MRPQTLGRNGLLMTTIHRNVGVDGEPVTTRAERVSAEKTIYSIAPGAWVEHRRPSFYGVDFRSIWSVVTLTVVNVFYSSAVNTIILLCSSMQHWRLSVLGRARTHAVSRINASTPSVCLPYEPYPGDPLHKRILSQAWRTLITIVCCPRRLSTKFY